MKCGLRWTCGTPKSQTAIPVSGDAHRDTMGKEKLDPDNLIGSLKPVIDALVWSQVLIDDTEQYLAIGKIRQEKLKKR